MKVIEMAEPQMGDDEVLLRMRYVGFCGSDLNTFRGGNPMVKMPVVPGHEVGAEIVSVGKNEVINELEDLLESGFRGKELSLVQSMVKEIDLIEDDTDHMQINLRRQVFIREKDLKHFACPRVHMG